MTGLPDCELGSGYDPAYGCVWWMAMGGGFTLFIPSLGSLFFVIPVCWPDTRTSVYESRGCYFSRCTVG